MYNLFYVIDQFEIDKPRRLSIDDMARFSPDFFIIKLIIDSEVYFLIKADYIYNNQQVIDSIRDCYGTKVEAVISPIDKSNILNSDDEDCYTVQYDNKLDNMRSYALAR